MVQKARRYRKRGNNCDDIKEENIVEVSTDKLVAEIPSPAKGRVNKLYFEPEQSCQVGEALCDILVEDGTIEDKTVEKAIQQKEELKVEQVYESFSKSKPCLIQF
jgi:2-oxoisovalerate dehydrogenase E2 component (dihydrolipoyl transacylase)